MANPGLIAFLQASRAAGLLSTARKLTRDTLTILCYHGFSVDDEHVYLPGMFVSEQTLRRRMELLRDRGYRVISLDEGVRRLRLGTVEPDTVVITVDDGFAGTLKVAAPVWNEFGFPSTLYLCTYYVTHQTPIYSFMLINLFLRSDREWVDLSDLAPGIPERLSVRGGSPADPNWLRVARILDAHYPLEKRDAVYAEIGRALAVDYASLRDRRLYHLLTPGEVRACATLGVDVQLHTHRHRLPEDDRGIRDEIECNRRIIGELCESSLVHFCYPSGHWLEGHLKTLADCGIESATTCDIGENRSGTHPLKLRRFLDREDISDLEFEAEVSGYKPLLRRALRRERGTTPR